MQDKRASETVAVTKVESAAPKAEFQLGPSILAGEQQAALDYLRLGKSVSETARAAGIGRSTIYHWLKNDPAFQAAFNQWQDEIEQSSRARLTMLTDKAVDALVRALDDGDARAAMQLVKGIGLLNRPAERLTDAREIEKRTKLDLKRRRLELEQEDRKLDVDDQVSRMMDRDTLEMVADKPANERTTTMRTRADRRRATTIRSRREVPPGEIPADEMQKLVDDLIRRDGRRDAKPEKGRRRRKS
jgi:transposase-like protein